jgi:hypothetical protein
MKFREMSPAAPVIYPCNINENSRAAIWNGPSYQAFRRQTITRAGLAAMSRRCDCAYCNYTDNDRVNRIFKWIAPFCRRDLGSR